MKIPRLLAISSPAVVPGAAWRRWCAALAAAGVDALQVRCKGCSDRDLLGLTTEARSAAPEKLAILVNARPDIVLAAGAQGVHLPAAGLPIAPVRRALDALPGGPLLIGRSTHSVEEIRLARDQGADFALFGPVFETPSKAGRMAPRGLHLLTAAVATGLPVLALGGIDASNARQIVDCGASGLAAIRWFEDPVAGGAQFQAVLRLWQAA